MCVSIVYLNNFKIKFYMYIALGNDNVRPYPNNIIVSTLEEFMKELNQELLWIEARDIWYINSF
jgi:hypothetical protein